jgi:trehalose 6-phosphate synthase/phosphatase
VVTKSDVGKLKKAYQESKSRVIICDYGGTLLAKEAPGIYIKKDVSATAGRKPTEAVLDSLEVSDAYFLPHSQLLRSLSNNNLFPNRSPQVLSADPNNTVFVVSGVNRRELDLAIGDVGKLGLAASNGACFAWPAKRGGQRRWQAFEFGVDWEAVKATAIPIMSKYAARTNGSSLKVLDLSLSWSFFSSDPEWGSLQATYIVPELQEVRSIFRCNPTARAN